MKIAILDCFNEKTKYKNIFEVTKNSKIRYCSKFQMDFLVFNFEIKNRTQHWGRIFGIKNYLKNYDYIVYLDTDTLITNFNFDIRNLIDSKYNIITGPLPHQGHIGTNGIIIKNSTWTFEFLDLWYNQDQFIDKAYHGSPSCGTDDDGGLTLKPENWKFYEQSAFHFLYDNDELVRKNTKLIERKYFHSVPKTFKNGDFLIHTPGMPPDKKINLIKKYIKIL